MVTCRRGHPRIVENVSYFPGRKGKLYPQCRICHNLTTLLWQRLRYRSDPAYRKAKSARANAYYHENKVLKGTSNASV